jgi:hypothetical protein
VIQAVSVVGALLILGAYAANQFGWTRTTNLVYALANVVGAGVLTVVAIVERQWGFLLLEGVWTLVALIATVGILRGSGES